MLLLSILFNPLERVSKPINIINQSEWSKKIVDRISTKASLSTAKSEANPTRLLKLFDMLAERNNTKNKKFVAPNIFKKHIFVTSMMKIDILETTAILLKLNLQSYNFNLCIIKTISKVDGSGSIQNNS